MFKYLFCALCFLSGCSVEPEASVKKFVHETKKQNLEPVLPLPRWTLSEGVHYESSHLRSPFEPAITSLLDKPIIEERPQELLEHYPLDALRMVGTVYYKNQLTALIRDNVGCVHTVRVNDRIGQHSGKIMSITEKTIEIVEWIADSENRLIERHVPMHLL